MCGLQALALVLWVVSRSPTINWLTWLMAVPAVAMSLLADFGGYDGLLPTVQMLQAVLYFYAAVGLIIYMFGDHRVTLDELLAVGTTFTLLAWSWAFAYSASPVRAFRAVPKWKASRRSCPSVARPSMLPA